MPSPKTLPAWTALEAHYQTTQDLHLRELFAADPERAQRFSLQLDDLLFDYSKNRITAETRELLLQLARQADIENWRERGFNGEAINHTEQRAVLHTALRNRDQQPRLVNGQDVMPEVREELRRIKALADAIRSRQWRGAKGQAITDVVNIGIGGSHLGPQMAVEALYPYCLHDLGVHFVNNVDENHIQQILEKLKPETTLFIIASKSFTTQETALNAQTARDWLLRDLDDESQLSKHLVAISSNVPAAVAFGVDPNNIFKMWDWVGGRYSLWSAIGLATAIAIGPEHFDALLDGAYRADQHFLQAPLEDNIPVHMALLGIWYNNFHGAETHAILPYDQYLHRFPAYLQQADMESNGKHCDRDGQSVDYQTGPIIWGEIGNAGQHAFYQLLHQGTKLIPADILVSINNSSPIADHHRALMSNAFAQTEALMKGKTADEARTELQAQGLKPEQIQQLLPYKTFPGNRPTNTLIYSKLDPKTLGTLIALYEHKIFVQGIIWNLNSFDQWGVELGKVLAKTIDTELHAGKSSSDHDSSTQQLINYYLKQRAPGT